MPIPVGSVTFSPATPLYKGNSQRMILVANLERCPPIIEEFRLVAFTTHFRSGKVRKSLCENIGQEENHKLSVGEFVLEGNLET